MHRRRAASVLNDNSNGQPQSGTSGREAEHTEVILEGCMSLKLSNIFVSPWYSPLHLGLSHPQVTYNNRGCAFISLQALRIMFS